MPVSYDIGGASSSASGGFLSGVGDIFNNFGQEGSSTSWAGDIFSSGGSGSSLVDLGSSSSGGLDVASLGAGFLDSLGLNITQNLSNVMNYGLSSWNATTTPEGIGQYLQIFEQDVQQKVMNLANGNIQDNLNELCRFIWWGFQFYDRMKADHASAQSTKEAYILAIDFFKKQRVMVFLPLSEQLDNAGYIVSKTRRQGYANMYLHLGEPVDQGDPKVYVWDYVLNIEKMAQDMSNGGSSGGSGNGRGDEKTAGGGSLIVGGVLFALWKLLS